MAVRMMAQRVLGHAAHSIHEPSWHATFACPGLMHHEASPALPAAQRANDCLRVMAGANEAPASRRACGAHSKPPRWMTEGEVARLHKACGYLRDAGSDGGVSAAVLADGVLGLVERMLRPEGQRPKAVDVGRLVNDLLHRL